jgi:hypothetical protein
MKFVAENPFAAHDVSTKRRRDESPGFVKCKSIEFFMCGLMPMRVM